MSTYRHVGVAGAAAERAAVLYSTGCRLARSTPVRCTMRVLLLFALLLLVPASANASPPRPARSASQATPISHDFCERSLRGQTGQAPDNDALGIWRAIEAGQQPGKPPMQLYYSGPLTWSYTNPLQLFVLWKFSGAFDRFAWFECWRDKFVPTGQYRDQFYNWSS